MPDATRQVRRGGFTGMAWTPNDIPDQTGRTFVITGGNSGIGYHAAKHLVQHGAVVVLACRRLDAAEEAAARINGQEGATGLATAKHLDLIDPDSVRRFVQEDAPDSIDVLVNNAGVMMTPRRIGPQGLESQWAINVVGHALLTKLLLPRITDRVVTVSSIAHLAGRIEPETWDGTDYEPWKAYRQSKLGDMVFGLRLQKHLDATGSNVKSVICHPGVSLTRLAKDMPLGLKLAMILYVPFLQSGDKGSWPTLRAATDDVEGGSYWGPRGFREMRGAPAEARIAGRAKKPETQDLVWDAVWENA